MLWHSPGRSIDNGDGEIIAEARAPCGGGARRERFEPARCCDPLKIFEESGSLLARPKGSQSLIDAEAGEEIEATQRVAFQDGQITFAQMLVENDLWLALDELVPYAHWITPEGMPNRSTPPCSWLPHGINSVPRPQQTGCHPDAVITG